MIDRYNGLQYDFRSYNCWQHVRKLRSDNGLETPDFDVSSPSDIDSAFERGLSDSKGLVKVDEPKDFDVVLMQFRVASKLKWHSGVYYKGFISHCSRAAKQVRIEPLSSILENYEKVEFWR